MAAVQRERRPEIPEWWKEDLYNYLEAMPREGWVWEFARRDWLKVIFGPPVEAMHPLSVPKRAISRTFEKDPHIQMVGDLGSALVNKKQVHQRIYLFHLSWDKLVERGASGFVPPLSVKCPSQGMILRDEQSTMPSIDTIFIGTRLYSRMLKTKDVVQLRLDMSFGDSSIKYDFKELLKRLRGKFPAREGAKFRPTNWLDNKILQVWDLRQLSVSLSRIEKLLFPNRPTKADTDRIYLPRNAYKTAKYYIDELGWIKLSDFTRKGDGTKTDLRI